MHDTSIQSEFAPAQSTPPELRRTFAPGDAPPQAAHPKIGRLIDYWRTRLPDKARLPGRRHFEPLDVPDLLPHLWLIDVVSDDVRKYRIRLVGGGLVEAGTIVRKGRFFDQLMSAADAVRTTELFETVTASRNADWHRGRAILSHWEHIREIERVILPLANDGVEIDMLLCMTLFYWRDGRVF